MSTTARDLARRLRLLVVLGVVTTVALFAAYRGVHADAVPMSSRSAPGVLSVETTKYALQQAKRGAALDAAGNTDFHTQISVANQSLALAASQNVTGPRGRQALQTVAGLIAVYSGFVEQANREDSRSTLHDVYMLYANRVYDTPGSAEDIMGYLDLLQKEQRGVAEQQASFGLPLWLGWTTASALVLALCLALAEAQRFCRRRFRTLVNLPLLAAAAGWAAGVLVLGALTLRAHTKMADVLADLPKPSAVPVGDIPETSARIAQIMRPTGAWAAMSDWILLGGAALTALMVAGLLPRVLEYRFKAAR